MVVGAALLALAAACVQQGGIDGVQPDAPPPSRVAVSTEIGPGPNPRPDVLQLPCDRTYDAAGVLRPADPEATEPTVRPRAEPECGVMIVPEVRDDGASPSVEVAFLRLPALLPDDESEDDAVVLPPGGFPPLLVLADGPGASAIDDLGLFVASRLRRGRDLILMDGRGSGRSFPSLDCGEQMPPGSVAGDLVADCRRDLADDGIMLEAYDAASMAADVADLAVAMDVTGGWHLLGVGHGARVALTVMRDHPDAVAAMVLDSPVPPEVDVLRDRPLAAQTALNRLFDACAQAPECSDTFGDLRRAVERTVATLQRVPLELADGGPIRGDDLVLAALSAMQGSSGPAVVPAALARAVEGEPAAAVATLLAAGPAPSVPEGSGLDGPGTAAPRPRSFSEGVLLSAMCRDEAPFSEAERLPEVQALGPIGDAVARESLALLRACAVWGVGAADEVESQRISGDVPALILTGEFDPLAPPAWGAAAATGISAAQVVQVGGAGHRVVDGDVCADTIVAAFLVRPRARVDDACASERRISFALG